MAKRRSDGKWFLIGIDVNLNGTPCISLAIGPFDVEQSAIDYIARVREPGSTYQVILIDRVDQWERRVEDAAG